MIKISDDYLIGFVEGEGMFYIGIVPSKETTSGWQVIYFFKVSQNPSGKIVLEYFKRRFSCGYIKSNSKTDLTDKSLAFVVRNYNDLITKVIPFFDGKLFVKKSSFERFKQVLELVGKRKHLNKEGLSQIIDLAYSMNTGKRKFAKEFVLKSYKG
ncbi:LAGLIDADG family homing endonuclease [Patescibacteria group bacterium]|nr:LAGLIDADG family homing endonuclease [Patescibacteria group bacterium]